MSNLWLAACVHSSMPVDVAEHIVDDKVDFSVKSLDNLGLEV